VAWSCRVVNITIDGFAGLIASETIPGLGGLPVAPPLAMLLVFPLEFKPPHPSAIKKHKTEMQPRVYFPSPPQTLKVVELRLWLTKRDAHP
jgi:hypothetical protein